MKLNVQGIEEIELTDPQGLCNPPVPQMPPAVNPFPPQPQIPTSITPFSPQPAPPIGPHTEWGVGGPMIKQAGQQVDPDYKSGAEGQENGKGNYHYNR